jgi:formylglycine-generating enzyme required for sulfatase activity
MTNKNFFKTLLLTAAMSSASLNAQVTIGSDKEPEGFSILELISNGRSGLRLPQLTQKQRVALEATFGAEATGVALGLQIFNTNSKCVETWNGAEWIQQCDGVPPLIVIPPAHYDPACAAAMNCTALDGFAVTPLADADLVFDGSVNLALAAAGAAFTMKPVTGGVFYMGNQASNASYPNYAADGYAENVHQVGLSSFYMGETEVTQGLWTAVMGSHNNWTYAWGQSATHPAYNENLYACIAFCNKLSLLLGKTPCYSVRGVNDWAALTYANIPTVLDRAWNDATCDWTASGFRLPTEAEWEYAARGGQKNEYTRTLGVSGTQYLYSGSNTLNNVAAYYNSGSYVNQGSDRGGDGSSSIWVKQLQANELGLYDMSGNVHEWCWDWYAAYPTCCDESDPKGTATGSNRRVYRGGSWEASASRCLVSTRTFVYTYDRYYELGFRVACKP